MYAPLNVAYAGDNPYSRNGRETFGMPGNYKIPPARIYIVNHSRTRQWKRVIASMSQFQGADEVLRASPELRKDYTADSLYREVQKGRDKNVYKMAVHPVAQRVRIPGRPDGNGGSAQSEFKLIPPADKADEKPMAIEVPDGTWDNYLGNYERMRGLRRGFDGELICGPDGKPIVDARLIGEEKTRLALHWKRRHNPVFAFTDDGVTTDLGNPYGILEFVRVSVQVAVEPIDREFLTALDIVES